MSDEQVTADRLAWEAEGDKMMAHPENYTQAELDLRVKQEQVRADLWEVLAICLKHRIALGTMIPPETLLNGVCEVVTGGGQYT